MRRILKTFEKVIIFTLLALMMIAVFVATIELGIILIREMISEPFLLMDIKEMLEVFGFFLMVLIGVELLESIKAYMEDDRVRAEVVFLVAMVAVARKVIIIEYKELSPLMLFGIASLLLSLGTGYYLVRRAIHTCREDYQKGQQSCPQSFPEK